MILLLSNAMAWQSMCYTGHEDYSHPDHPAVCEDGYEKARNRWVWDEGFYGDIRIPEHEWIWAKAAKKSGVPLECNGCDGPGIFEDYELDTFVRPDHLEQNFTSIWPRGDIVGEKYTRTLRAGEMSQLPDMSYSLWDWAMGNEVCPVSDVLSVTGCHRFDQHMGGLNSNHFLPQSEHFYRWYHDLAIARASQCNEAHEKLNHLYGEREDLQEYVLACERSAMTIEAVGQHYLQDSWSSGHMWERWGSPQLEPWLAASGGDYPEAIGRAMLVSMVAGSWHGVKGVMADPSSFTSNHVYEWDDPLCAPAPSGYWDTTLERFVGEGVVEYVDLKTGQRQAAVGDIFYSESLNSPYDVQHDSMLKCSVGGIRQVYEATGQAHGALENPGTGTVLDPESTNDCFGQRVTNASLETGAGIHSGTAPNQRRSLAHEFLWTGGKLKYDGGFWGLVQGQEEVDVEQLEEQFQKEFGAFLVYVGVRAKLGEYSTDLARGFAEMNGSKSFMGIEPNSAYMKPLGTKPAEWVDPKLPWDLDEERGEALSLVFADASAWGRCGQMDEKDLNALRHLAWPVVPEKRDFAVKGLCEQLVGPFLRIGTGAGHYNDEEDMEPLCHFSPNAGSFVYSGDIDYEDVERGDALDDFCTGGLLEDGGFEQRSDWDLEENADVLSGINTLIPYAGSQMLDLYLTPTAGAAYGIARQHLDDDIPEGDWELQFMWRVWTSHDGGCVDWLPWAVARVDRVDTGQNEVAVYEVDHNSWCEDLEFHAGGQWKNDWTEASLSFSGPVEDPVISFIGGTGSGTQLHHLLIDEVKLVKGD